MSHFAFLLLAAAAAPANGAASPEIEAGRAYASCIGMTAVVRSAATRTVEEAIAAAFDECSDKRIVAIAAITAFLERQGLSEARAAQEAENTVSENDRMMADMLHADITTFRRTGHPPTHDPN